MKKNVGNTSEPVLQMITSAEKSSTPTPHFANIADIYELVATAIDDVVSLHTLNGAFLFVSPSVQKVLGYTPAELIYSSITDLTHPSDTKRLRPLALMQQNRNKTRTILWRCRHKTGHFLYLETKATLLLDDEGRPVAILCASRDVTERENLLAKLNASRKELTRQKRELERANARLSTLATIDGLTGLKNHRAFQEQLEIEFRRARRYQLPLSLLMLDVDHFKLYNDTYGHLAGDEVLQHVARLLTLVARQTDFVCRYGGEEFAVILPNTPADGALALAERYRTTIASENWSLRPITISIGAASLTPEIQCRAELIEKADRALYHSKQNGRNRVTHIREVEPILQAAS
ncbi:PAS domain S-box/diguanylate cyclase (GGDEF) domain-containing protein [Chthonomonas calidirosea]|uniref:sensor domain-containing diguanylate cyclase n=1 Tax=Chthonomonas calidirosea TaxID=454171 RepID=UPI0006DD43B5|nr:GGDEF domain-containing protein [Chthonomonas calidirosea]CEK14292.1 PAS domain S-box/diguanylate cyclase (GGDEF) domain-containing protein [Chthonomonas calidirosea]